MRPCFIFDIDGTISDPSRRRRHIEKSPKDWDRFFIECACDDPIPHMQALYAKLNGDTIFVTGRPERTRDLTIEWLVRYNYLPYDAHWSGRLYMRKDGDRRDDDIVKLELLQQVRNDGWSPIMVFDDRDRVVKMWRDNGVPCAQVAPGDF